MMDKSILETLSKEKSHIQKLLESIRKINRYQSKPLDNLHKIKYEVSRIEQKLKQTKLNNFTIKELDQYIQSVKSKISDWEEETRRNFGQKLEEGLKKEGFELRGHYPLLKVSLYTLEVNFENSKVLIWYGPRQEKLETCKLDPNEIIRKIKVLHGDITQRCFDDTKFLSKIYEAYNISVYRQNKKLGDQIPISDILFTYAFLIQDKKFKMDPTKSNYKEYGRVYFSYDLYRLKKRRIDDKELNLITATRAYTRRRSDFLWIPSNERGDGDYISHIKFREVKS